MATIDVKLNPFLRWAGSKRKLLPKLVPFWNDDIHMRYVEPFMGSAVFFFAIDPQEALLSDTNSELIDTFISVRDHPRAVFNRYSKFEKGEKAYYQIRKINPTELSTLDRAARFIYLNRFCFNGIYRTNLQGGFNVPFAGTGKLPDWATLNLASKALKEKTILCEDFESILRKQVKKGDFVYLDPPYAVSNRRIFRQYGPHSFGLDDIDRLKNSLDIIDSKGASFLVSYAMCTEALEAFSKWNVHRTLTQRNIAGFAKHRKKAVELLITNIKN